MFFSSLRIRWLKKTENLPILNCFKTVHSDRYRMNLTVLPGQIRSLNKNSLGHKIQHLNLIITSQQMLIV